jgi:hypothetical protein
MRRRTPAALDDDTLARALEAKRETWPLETRTNPMRCPLIEEAADLRSLADVSNVIASHVAIPRAAELERQHQENCHHDDA